MKKNFKTLTIVFGIIVAIVALSNSMTYAENMDTKATNEIVTIETEMLLEVEQMLLPEEAEEICEQRIKIFNSERRLVYECRGKDDERLKLLLRRSDLMFQTDSSSYYLLGD